MTLLPRLLALTVISSCFAGCADGQSGRSSPGQDVSMERCFIAVEEAGAPVLDMGKVNSRAPIMGLDMQYQQKERVLKAGGGACEDEVPTPTVPECDLVSGPISSLDPDYESTFLWRSGEKMAEYLFSGGASEVLFEGVTGYAGKSNLKEYRYRAWVITYGSTAEARESPIWKLIGNCSPEGGSPAASVRDVEYGIVLRAVGEGSKVVVVEPWVGERDGESGSHGLVAGLLSEQGTRFIADAVAKSVVHSPLGG